MYSSWVCGVTSIPTEWVFISLKNNSVQCDW